MHNPAENGLRNRSRLLLGFEALDDARAEPNDSADTNRYCAEGDDTYTGCDLADSSNLLVPLMLSLFFGLWSA
jgi:hypothetical protein